MTILVTGGNRGIGLALCGQLAARGDRVITTCRRSSPELEALDVRVLEGIDVSDDVSVASLVASLDGEKIDVLINNAGILSAETLDDLDLERIRRQFEVNALGPLRVTTALRPNLAQGSKVAIITSLMGSLTDNTSGGYYGYRISKAAVNAVGRNLARDFSGQGIAVLLLHPGLVATEMTGRRGVTAEQSATGLLERIDTLGLDDSGSFWHAEGRPLPW